MDSTGSMKSIQDLWILQGLCTCIDLFYRVYGLHLTGSMDYTGLIIPRGLWSLQDLRSSTKVYGLYRIYIDKIYWFCRIYVGFSESYSMGSTGFMGSFLHGVLKHFFI